MQMQILKADRLSLLRMHLCCALVDTSNHGVVSLEGLKGKLLLGLDALLSHLLNLTGEDGLGGSSRVDTVGLDGDKDTTTDLQEQVSVRDQQGKDLGSMSFKKFQSALLCAIQQHGEVPNFLD